MRQQSTAISSLQTKPWPPLCWAVTDGSSGMESQCVGLAEAMGITPVLKRMRLQKFWREIGLHLTAMRRLALKQMQMDVDPPWPDMLIGCGRTSVLASLYIKRASKGQTFTVQIQNPVAIPFREFDRVIVPEHDGLRKDNVICMTGALHRVTAELLRQEAARWAPYFAHLPRPYTAVLLGGSNASYTLGPAEIADIGDKLDALAQKEKTGLLITASRRTGVANTALLRTRLWNCPAVIWDGEGDNPYYGMLGLADAFVVTCDSVNLICEACSTGKPVHMIQLPGRSAKFEAFHRSMLGANRIRLFNGALERWQYEPLREMNRVAALVQQAYTAAKS